jgi:hypothetical protein
MGLKGRGVSSVRREAKRRAGLLNQVLYRPCHQAGVPEQLRRAERPQATQFRGCATVAVPYISPMASTTLLFQWSLLRIWNWDYFWGVLELTPTW